MAFHPAGQTGKTYKDQPLITYAEYKRLVCLFCDECCNSSHGRKGECCQPDESVDSRLMKVCLVAEPQRSVGLSKVINAVYFYPWYSLSCKAVSEILFGHLQSSGRVSSVARWLSVTRCYCLVVRRPFNGQHENRCPGRCVEKHPCRPGASYPGTQRRGMRERPTSEFR